MNILFVTPYPPSRIRVRGYGFVQNLQREHELTILTQVSSQQEQNDSIVLQQQGYEVISVPVSRQFSLLHSGLAVLSTTPLQIAYARSSHFFQQVQKLCGQRNFDVIHVEHLRGIASMDLLALEQPLVWDAVDCMSDLWRQTARSGPSWMVRAVASLEYKRTASYEQLLWQHLEHIVITSEVDRQSLLALAAGPVRLSTDLKNEADIEVIPCGVDLDYFVPREQSYRPYNIVFSGKMSYHANVAAALHLYQHIMPLIWREQPAATLTIVGSKPPLSLRRLQSDARVEVTGYVDDIRPYIRRAHVMLSPMVYCVGIQNKVLETMALGTPTVISTQSARALAACAGQDMFVATSAQEYANAALSLMTDSVLRENMCQRARSYVELHHDWSVVTEKLVSVYYRAITVRMNRSSATVPATPANKSVHTS